MSKGSTHSRLLWRRMATNTICRKEETETINTKRRRELNFNRAPQHTDQIPSNGSCYLGHNIGDRGWAYYDAVLVLEEYPCMNPRLRTEQWTKMFSSRHQEFSYKQKLYLGYFLSLETGCILSFWNQPHQRIKNHLLLRSDVFKPTTCMMKWLYTYAEIILPYSTLTIASNKGNAARYKKAFLVLFPTWSFTWWSLLMM